MLKDLYDLIMVSFTKEERANILIYELQTYIIEKAVQPNFQPQPHRGKPAAVMGPLPPLSHRCRCSEKSKRVSAHRYFFIIVTLFSVPVFAIGRSQDTPMDCGAQLANSHVWQCRPPESALPDLTLAC